ncbi:hypothetical protein [Flavobacterium sp.]|jgi:hypothetical protein|uniref:hypothetical protein n=1 Tax=Flavobacterium sp. TaxID=239 RepID=UPI0035B4A58F
MKKFLLIFAFTFFNAFSLFSQTADNTAILKLFLAKYYSSEKVIVKNRLQLLSLYCNKAPNTEELLEVISKNELLKKNSSYIKSQINPSVNENWNEEISQLFNNQNQYLKSKVQNCLSLEEFQESTKKYGENNQRLMIINKPIYFENNYCLIKVAIYRNIEHNSGTFFLLKKINSIWHIEEIVYSWET